MFYQKVLDAFVAAAKEIIGEQLTGIYLHGSLAMGCFHPKKSDIDIIVVIGEDISDIQKMEFMKRVVSLNRQAPEKGLEISVVKREFCNPFAYPTPYTLHFSPMHLQWFLDDPQSYVEKMNGDDKDLAAHFTIIKKYGIVLYGEEIEKVFSDVPQEYYIDSIWADIEDAGEEIARQPIYMTLNLCRVFAFLRDGLYLSKEEGGKWGLAHLPLKYHPLLSDALACYATDRDMNIDEELARLFAEEMQTKIKGEMSRKKKPA